MNEELPFLRRPRNLRMLSTPTFGADLDMIVIPFEKEMISRISCGAEEDQIGICGELETAGGENFKPKTSEIIINHKLFHISPFLIIVFIFELKHLFIFVSFARFLFARFDIFSLFGEQQLKKIFFAIFALPPSAAALDFSGRRHRRCTDE